jgi:2-dehydro-3-deoxygalactonokinase
MTQALPCILGDWGTSRLRLHLCIQSDDGVRILGTASGPGIRDAGDCRQAFVATARKLPPHAPDTDVVLSGMVGSNIGWRETAYVPCPAGWRALAANSISIDADGYKVRILAGVSCINRFGYRDVMRGEETQILGWAAARRFEFSTDRLLCLPGTHTKWAIVGHDGIRGFDTTMPGELFDMLNRHSILTQGSASENGNPDSGPFLAAIDRLRDNPDLTLLQALFSTRALQLSGALAAGEASAYLSGLLIGEDIRGVAINLLEGQALDDTVTVIGEELLMALYVAALERFGIRAVKYDGAQAAIDGLFAFQDKQ